MIDAVFIAEKMHSIRRRRQRAGGEMRGISTVLSLLALALPAACGGGSSAGGDAGSQADADADSDSDTDTGDTSNGGDTDSASDSETDTGSEQADPAAPLFEQSASYAIEITPGGDPADVYHPDPPDLGEEGYSFPLAVMLQGAEVDKQHYSGFAGRMARYGFVVVVPNHHIVSITGPGLYAEQSQVEEVIERMTAENGDDGSPLAGAIETSTAVVLGHSYGGVCALNVLRGVCEPPGCMGLSYDRPEQVAGGALWGTNLAMPFVGTMVNSIQTDGLPVAYVQGTLDSKAPPEDTQEAYSITGGAPKAYVGVIGANHYGQCDVNNPPGAAPDSTPPEIDQEVALETIARWSAIFLRAHALGDEQALEYLHESGGSEDENVNVVAEVP